MLRHQLHKNFFNVHIDIIKFNDNNACFLTPLQSNKVKCKELSLYKMCGNQNKKNHTT